MIRLFISYYKDKSEVRQRELEHCIQKNIENKFIDKIIVLLEGCDSDFPILNNNKVCIVQDCPRATYKAMFEYANKLSSQDDISIIANTDIYFDETVQKMNTLQNHFCYALSRWHEFPDGNIALHNEQYSQDVWAFRGLIKFPRFCDFHLGVPGCDNRIAYELHKAGYLLMNPAYDIKCYHNHKSDLHNYSRQDKIEEPYKPVPVCGLCA